VFAEPIDLGALLQNTFQSLYHLVRLEFGIILENQIYASPEMFNRTILDVYIPDDVFGSPHSAANSSRILTSNTTAMAQWMDSVRLFNNSDRVPVLPYLRTAPRLKPLGSAITSIFVSTFAMLSVAWTIFKTIAGAFIGSQAGKFEIYCFHMWLNCLADTAVSPENEVPLNSGLRMRRDVKNQKVPMEGSSQFLSSIIQHLMLSQHGTQANLAS
jgi:hypothetical protein